jgi:hypothetical protein
METNNNETIKLSHDEWRDEDGMSTTLIVFVLTSDTRRRRLSLIPPVLHVATTGALTW